jgi:DNA-binding NtrC family response regulator
VANRPSDLSPADRPARPAGAAAGDGARARSVLVVDDDPQILDLLRALLQELEFEVATVDGGRAALAAVAASPPDLLITDVVMPDMEGMQLLREINRTLRGLPVIVMSGNPVGVSLLEATRHFGARATLRKPFSLDELRMALDAALGET